MCNSVLSFYNTLEQHWTLFIRKPRVCNNFSFLFYSLFSFPFQHEFCLQSSSHPLLVFFKCFKDSTAATILGSLNPSPSPDFLFAQSAREPAVDLLLPGCSLSSVLHLKRVNYFIIITHLFAGREV
uniref:Uncharacterized protein n=1 Tax=Cynoglossus semilaevis TaxID=244447 RepID=A0A3P8WKN9_CYNSE